MLPHAATCCIHGDIRCVWYGRRSRMHGPTSTIGNMCSTVTLVRWGMAITSYIKRTPSTKGTYTNVDHRCGQHIELTLINHPYTTFPTSFSFLVNRANRANSPTEGNNSPIVFRRTVKRLEHDEKTEQTRSTFTTHNTYLSLSTTCTTCTKLINHSLPLSTLYTPWYEPCSS